MTDYAQLDAWIAQWAASTGPAEEFLRLLLAALAGGLVGLEREVRGRQAGFRTNLLVCLGSALVMIVSIRFASHPWETYPHVNLNVDPARIAYGVMTGIGFLGAGTIIQTRGSVRGLTTAAGLWCVAAIGLASGFGLYSISIISSLMVLLALWLLDYAEDALPKMRYRVITVRRHWSPGVIEQTTERFRAAGLAVEKINFQRSPDLSHVDVDLYVSFNRTRIFDQFRRQIEQDPEWLLLSMGES